MFTELLRVQPELEPVVTNLVEDHQMTRILTAILALATESSYAGAHADRQ